MPSRGRLGRSSLDGHLNLLPGCCSKVGERVTGVTVPGEALDAVGDQRPADRRGDRDEQLGIVDPRRGLGQQGITLRRDRRLARGVHQLSASGSQTGDRAAAEAADEPRRRGRRGDLVDQREIGWRAGLRARSTVEAERAPVAAQLGEQQVGAGTVAAEQLGSSASALPNSRSAAREAPRADRPRRSAEPGRRGRRRDAVEPRLEQRGARRQARERRARRCNASRSIAWRKQAAHVGLVEPPAARGPGPARTGPTRGRSAALLRGSFTRCA